MSEEEIKQTNEEPIEETTANEEGKQKSKVGKFFSSIGSSKPISAIKARAKFVKDKAVTAYDKHQETQRNHEMFEKEAIGYTVYSEKIKNGDVKDAVQFFAVKTMQDSSLLVRVDDELTVNTIILSTEGQFIINDVDSKTQIDYPLDGSSPYPIKCYKCLYKAHKIESAPSVVNNVINQSNVIHGNNYGDVTLVAKQQNDLDTIEQAIKSSKPSIFHKNNKTEAIEMFGTFKNCVLEQRRDEGFFAKFLKVLETLVSATIIGLVQGLIAAIPH